MAIDTVNNAENLTVIDGILRRKQFFKTSLANKSLHRKAISRRSIAAGELGRYVGENDGNRPDCPGTHPRRLG